MYMYYNDLYNILCFCVIPYTVYTIAVIFLCLCHRTVQPLVTDDEFQVTEEIVKRFGSNNGIGVKLQRLLENRAKTTDNWVCVFKHFCCFKLYICYPY